MNAESKTPSRICWVVMNRSRLVKVSAPNGKLNTCGVSVFVPVRLANSRWCSCSSMPAPLEVGQLVALELQLLGVEDPWR